MGILDYLLSSKSQFVIDKVRGEKYFYEKPKPEHSGILRAALRSIYPKLGVDKISALESELGGYVGSDIATALGQGPVSDQKRIRAVQELAYTQSPQGQRIRDLSDLVFSERPDLKVETPVSSQQNKVTLRSRFILPGEDTARESKQQMVFDTSMAEMFSYHPPEIGISLLNEHNKLNQRIAWQSPSQPRSTYDQQVMPFPIPWQYQQFPVEPVMEHMIEEKAREAFVKHLPPRFDVLGDLQSNGTPYVDGVNQRKDFGPDPFYNLPVGYDNYLGFKPDLPKYWRDPLQPDELAQQRGKLQLGQGRLSDWSSWPGPQLLF